MDIITIGLIGIGGFLAYKFYAPKTSSSDTVPPGVKLDPNKKGTGFEDDPLSTPACSGDVAITPSSVLYEPYVGAFSADNDPDSLRTLASLLDENCHVTAANALRQKADGIEATGFTPPPCGVATPLDESDPLYAVYEAALVKSTSASAISSAADLLEAACHPIEAKSLRDKLALLTAFGAATAGVDRRRLVAVHARAAGR